MKSSRPFFCRFAAACTDMKAHSDISYSRTQAIHARAETTRLELRAKIPDMAELGFPGLQACVARRLEELGSPY
jgi:hypothetical protein